HWGRTLRDEVLAAGGTLVVRLDSGDPIDSIRYALESLGHSFGFSINGKGYRVLDGVRLLQGDGIDLSSLAHLCTAIADAGWSLDCFGTFGMGGALLQKVNRDTFSFAQKASWGVVDGEARDICKRPQGDPGKASKAGRIASHRHRGDGRWCTAIEGTLDAGEWQPMLEPVWRDGKLLREQDFADVRARAEAGFGRSAFP
ncbi:MAG TPA: nicotinate phosphoribosyltransferase, partial [Plasticicumulans sp.]|nr:nicotinate phosphoribosyltransferase [Plasticicumulans sp.]